MLKANIHASEEGWIRSQSGFLCSELEENIVKIEKRDFFPFFLVSIDGGQLTVVPKSYYTFFKNIFQYSFPSYFLYYSSFYSAQKEFKQKQQ